MFDKVKAIFEEQLGVSQDEMNLDTNFKDDLGVDSLDLYEIVMKMEEEFDVEIPAEELDNVATFEDVLNYLKSKGVEE
ncbi:acyl carrier protein [Coprococcus sp. CAG:782]|jgi:acyl carrier protein|uniref:acyl carrier protein n=1 Tax=Coprococcus sp. OM04-5BH TaxID=2293093 RepID=UPI00033EAEDE|nr:acyl carrier protein [Coprococcus sp. OM04-5BH]MEE0035878.1 acyl carrier protein [Coprococcus sp.]RHV33927.1 acyl carrier protein [Coprococcus sp. OM04-5BH]CCY54214.1 acyl carrier protein [Coprococcus sp. CAG:782]